MLWIMVVGMSLVAFLHLVNLFDFGMDYFFFRYYGTDPFPASSLLWFVILSVGAVIIVRTIFYLLEHDTYTELEVERQKLISVKSDQEISGKGSGSLLYYALSIENLNTYSFYYELSDGGVQKESIDAKYTVIYEKDGCEPRVEKHKDMKHFYHPIFMGVCTFKVYDSSDYSYHYEMYVPEGTILRKFRLNWSLRTVFHNETERPQIIINLWPFCYLTIIVLKFV